MEQEFTGSICGFEVTIILNSEGVVFVMVNPNSKQVFEARLPYEYEGKSKQVQEMFINLDEFYEYVVLYSEDPRRVFINEKGTIKVTYNRQKISAKNAPFVTIASERLVAGVHIREGQKIERDLRQIKQQNEGLKKIVEKLLGLSRANQSQLRKLQGALQEMSKMGERSSQQNGIEIGQKPLDTSSLSAALKTLKEAIKQIPPTILQKEQPNEHKGTANETEILLSIDYNNQYLVKEKQYFIRGNAITKAKKYGSYQLLCREVIPAMGRHYFTVFVEKISHHYLLIGLCKQSRRNYQHSHKTEDVILYDGKHGAVIRCGETRAAGEQIAEKCMIRVSVHLNQVEWEMNGKLIGKATMSEEMRKCQLVPYLQINYPANVIFMNRKYI